MKLALVNAGEAFKHGGFWMYPIMMLQVVSLAIVVERVFALFIRRKTDQSKFKYLLNFDLLAKRNMNQVFTEMELESF